MCTNPGHQVARPTKFCTVAPNFSGSSEWNMLNVTIWRLELGGGFSIFENLCTPAFL